jgi:hypothetical protein
MRPRYGSSWRLVAAVKEILKPAARPVHDNNGGAARPGYLPRHLEHTL